MISNLVVKNFPENFPTLWSERLVLKELTPEDSDSYFSLCRDPNFMRLFGVRHYQSLSDAAKAIEFLRRQFDTGEAIRWAVVAKEDPQEILGDVGFWRFDWRRHRGEIGYKMAPQCSGKGFMREAVERVLKFAFDDLQLNSIEANIATSNLASAGFIEKLGFEREGMRHEFSPSSYEEAYVDCFLYSLTRTKWRKQCYELKKFA